MSRRSAQGRRRRMRSCKRLEKRTCPRKVEVWGELLWKRRRGPVGVYCNMPVVVGVARARGHSFCV